MSAGTAAVGPADFIRPPAPSRPVVEEWFQGGAIITGRRTFDIANGWGARHPSAFPSSCSPTTHPTSTSAPAPAEHRRAPRTSGLAGQGQIRSDDESASVIGARARGLCQCSGDWRGVDTSSPDDQMTVLAES